jgi:chaperone modulatory protein CbpM
MIEGESLTVEMVCLRFSGLRPDDLQRWIGSAWVRPDSADGQFVFRDFDVERIRLILELRDEMQVNEDALPVVLSLLDQLYAMRRRMRRLRAAMDQTVTGDLRLSLMQLLGETAPPSDD